MPTIENGGSSCVSQYARESMQLFSVGLLELTEDGAYERDIYGNPIETYDTYDIGEFAKVPFIVSPRYLALL
jgi:uncharacterized protein (DUF1800 family)